MKGILKNMTKNQGLQGESRLLPEVYLARIGIQSGAMGKVPGLDLLTTLQEAHMLSVPFEDLDIPLQRIGLDIQAFYHKIVLRRRGGFCYELNGLFHWLLTHLGFKAIMVSGRVFNRQSKIYGPEFDHLALIVKLDRPYLIDVGFGDSVRVPIPLPDGRMEDVSGMYKVLPLGNRQFELQKVEEGIWMPQYRFTNVARALSDFHEMCSYQQDHPESHFRTRMLCTLATPNGRVTLSDHSLTITERGVKTRISLNNAADFDAMLFKHFGIRRE